VVIDTGLTPNTTHAYHTIRTTYDEESSPSNTLNVTTLPLTSNQFIWTIDTLGAPDQYSTVSDVAIVDADNIWVVGDIQTDSGRFNLAGWDGNEWQLSLIGAEGVIGEGIWYFSSNDVWVATGILYHWNGQHWERYHLWDMEVLGPDDGGMTSSAILSRNGRDPGRYISHRIRGTAYNNLWATGDGSEVLHFNGEFWALLPRFQSVWESGVRWYGLAVSRQTVAIAGSALGEGSIFVAWTITP